MLRTTDIVMVVIMTATAAVTYSIKHRAELKLEQVHKIDAEIRLEKDTIDLLKADWALLTQPNRLQRLIDNYHADLQLVPTASTQLARPVELPMLKADVPPPPEPKKGEKDKKGLKQATPVASAARKPAAPMDNTVAAKPAADDGVAAIIAGAGNAGPAGAPVVGSEAEEDTDSISTGAVAQ